MILEFEGYLFDMGNTLLDFHQGSQDAEKDRIGVERLTRHLKQNYDLTITEELLTREFLNPWLGDFPLREKGRELDVSFYLNRALVPFSLELTDAECALAMGVWFSEYKKQVVVNPHALSTLASAA